MSALSEIARLEVEKLAAWYAEAPYVPPAFHCCPPALISHVLDVIDGAWGRAVHEDGHVITIYNRPVW